MEEKGEVHVEGTVRRASAVHESSIEIPEVTWWKSRGLIHLYAMIPILFLGSTVSGYDGSLNDLQTIPQWQMYFDNPAGARLGLVSIFNVLESS